MRLALIIAALGAAFLSGACTRPSPPQATPYQLDEGTSLGGYSEKKLSESRYRVRFLGNTRTSRSDVERGLLYRAAEITLDNGQEWFQIITRDTETKRHTERYRHGYVPGPSLFAHRHHRRYGHGYGGYGRGFFGGGFYDVEERVSERFDASADIEIRSGERDPDTPRAYDARAILAVIGPTLRRPSES